MENKAAKKKNSLKHRFAQILLGSSCTTTTTSSDYSAIKLVALQPEEHSNCGIHDKLLLQQLDRSSSVDCFAPGVAPVVQVSINCGSRRSTHNYEPFISLTPRVEKTEKPKEKRPMELYEAIKNEQKRFPPELLSSCARNTSSYYYRGEEEQAKKKKTTSHQNKANAKRKDTMRLLSNAYGFSSSSSSDNGTGHGFYSSDDDDDDEEEESAGTLFSSRSFSSDSSEFYRSRGKNHTSNNNNKKSRSASMKCTRRPTRPPTRRRVLTPQKNYWDASDKFRPLVSYSSSTQKAEAKTVAKPEPSEAESEKTKDAEGFAVVKRSTDPYMDFRSSMVEMIVERRISSTKGLQGLLLSYLCLNSARHHPVIVEAFRDIWEAIFCCLD